MAVLVINMQLSFEAKFVAVFVLANAADIASEPAVAQNRADSIGTFFEQVGDVIGCVVDALFIVRPAGHEDVVANALAVEAELINPLGGGVNDRSLHSGGDCEFFS